MMHWSKYRNLSFGFGISTTLIIHAINNGCKRSFCVGVFVQQFVYCSGRVLSLKKVVYGEVTLPSSGPKHDEWRLCFLYVRDNTYFTHWSTMESIRTLRGWPGWFAETSACFLGRQTGSWHLSAELTSFHEEVMLKYTVAHHKVKHIAYMFAVGQAIGQFSKRLTSIIAVVKLVMLNTMFKCLTRPPFIAMPGVTCVRNCPIVTAGGSDAVSLSAWSKLCEHDNSWTTALSFIKFCTNT